MAETSTAAAPTAVVVESVPNNVKTASNHNKYQVNDDALKSLRNTHHSARRHTNNSGGNNTEQSPTANQLDNSRYSNQSTSSLWNSLVNRGRRIYGSAASVASSITFAPGDFSEDFWISERSLDVRDFAAEDVPHTDSQPNIPQRQTSVQALDVSNRTQDASGIPVPPKPIEYLRSSDLSPQRPGRKVSVANSSDTNAQAIACASSMIPQRPGRKVSLASDSNEITASIATQSTTPARNSAAAHPLRGSANSTDTIPHHPSRKKSSIVAEPLLGESQLLRTQAKCFRENLPLGTHMQDDDPNQSYENSFLGSEAIDHMMEIGLCLTRQEGVELATKFQSELGLLYAVAGGAPDQPFCEQKIYQLAPSIPSGSFSSMPSIGEPSPNLLSVRRKTDTSISIEEEAPLEERTAKHLTIPPVHPAAAAATSR